MSGHPFFGLRLLILAAMGLGALYMFHLLAQDYNRIRQPIAKLRSFLRLKRELSDEGSSENQRLLDRFDIDWQRILKFDPMNCLQSLACQLLSGAEAESEEGRNIKFLLMYSLNKNPPRQIVSAIEKGLEFQGDPKKCTEEYSYCFYSASNMLKIVRLFSKYLE